jgi:peptide deformylase
MLITNDRLLLAQPSTECVVISEVGHIDKELRAELYKHKNGVAIAAPQIGIFKRVFISPVNKKLITFVHPKLVEILDPEPCPTTEGCLSFPGTSVYTNRPRKIKVIDATEEERILIEIEAVAFQHELNHLDGITFFSQGVVTSPPMLVEKIGRNEPCPCGSGLKFKKCHG